MVHWSHPTEASRHIEQLARSRGLSVKHRALVEPGLTDAAEWDDAGRVIVLAELEKLIWKDIEGPAWLEFQKLMRAADSILWVTQGGLMAGVEPEAALVNGFFQCLDINPQMQVASMDFEKSSLRDEYMAAQILHYEDNLPEGRDKQYRQHEGRWLISRLVPDERLINDFARSEGTDQSPVLTPLKELGPVRISTTDAGRLSALVFRPDDALKGPLKPGYIEVKVKAIGMNMVVCNLTDIYCAKTNVQ